jgi:hypothetical protein
MCLPGCFFDVVGIGAFVNSCFWFGWWLLDEVLDLLGDDPYLPGAKQRGEAVVQRLRSAFMGGACT